MSHEELRRLARDHAWLLGLLLAGILLLMPAGKAGSEPTDPVATSDEQRLSRALSQMEGVGESCVLLSEKPGREAGYMGAVVVCPGADRPEVQLRIVETVSAFTGLGSHQIVVQKMISTGGNQ